MVMLSVLSGGYFNMAPSSRSSQLSTLELIDHWCESYLSLSLLLAYQNKILLLRTSNRTLREGDA